MTTRSNVSPQTLPVELEPEGVFVDYLDGRRVFYHGIPQKVEGSVRCPPGKQAHLLVTNDTGTEGILIYLNDNKTHSDILESTGVGRIDLRTGESEVIPGVTAKPDGHTIEISANPSVVDGRIFVFAEDEFEEHPYEIVAP